MRNTKLMAGIAALALVSASVFVVNQSGQKEPKTEKTETQKEDKNIVEAQTYTGETFVSSSLLSALEENVENNDELTQPTGMLVYSEAGFSKAIDSYGTYLAQTEAGDASVEALDVALKFVPEGSVIEGYTNLGVSNVDDYLNVRSGAGTDNSIIGKMPGGAACEVLGEENGWYQIQSGNVNGYVDKQYILTGYDANVKAMETMSNVLVVNCDVLNVRQEPSQDCAISDRVENGETLEIVEDENNGWYKVNINNLEGFVSAEFVNKVCTLPTAEEIGSVSQGASGSGASALIDYAYQFLGNPYVYGGNSLTNGIDCSGFVKQIFAQFGYSLPRTSGAYVGVGKTVSYSEAQPGDIIVYRYGDGSGHVAIYIGGGKIIHASTPKTGICIGNATFTTPYSVQRVLE